MADTVTTNYGLVKPEVGASNDTWGNKLNTNMDDIDTQMKANADAIAAALLKDGSNAFTGSPNFGGFKGTNAAVGTASTDLATVGQIGALVAAQSISLGQKTTPHVDDKLIISDSEALNVPKGLSYGNIRAAINTYIATLFAPLARTITTTGLLTGGGDFSANRTFDVPIPSQAEAEAGTNNTKAMTPLRTKQAIDLAITEADIPPTTAPSGSWVAIARTSGTTYTNTFEKDIALRNTSGSAAAITFEISPDGTYWITELESTANAVNTVKVPNGWKYRYTTLATGYSIFEYR